MGILSWLILGFTAGVLAKLLLPGAKTSGWLYTIVLGIVGAFVGGFVGSQLGIGAISGLNLSSIGLATGGAAAVLLIGRIIKK